MLLHQNYQPYEGSHPLLRLFIMNTVNHPSDCDPSTEDLPISLVEISEVLNDTSGVDGTDAAAAISSVNVFARLCSPVI